MKHLKQKYIEAVQEQEKLQISFTALTAMHLPLLVAKWEAEYQMPMPTRDTKPLVDRFQCNFNDIGMSSKSCIYPLLIWVLSLSYDAKHGLRSP